MAPMTSGIPNTHQDDFVLRPRLFERLLPPRMPFNRVVGMLEQIRTGFVNQSIGKGGVRQFACCFKCLPINGEELPIIVGQEVRKINVVTFSSLKKGTTLMHSPYWVPAAEEL